MDKIKNININFSYNFKKKFVIATVILAAAVASFNITSNALNSRLNGYDKENYSIYMSDSKKNIKKKNIDLFVYEGKITSLKDSIELVNYFKIFAAEHCSKAIYIDLDKCIDTNDNNSYDYIEYIINRCRSKGIYVSIIGSKDTLEKRKSTYDYNGICLKYKNYEELNDSLSDYASLYNVKKGKFYVAKKYSPILEKGIINFGDYCYEDEIYEIKSGDYLISIAEKYSMKFEDLVSYNNITDINLISEGSLIKIPYEFSNKESVEGSLDNSFNEMKYESYVVTGIYINVRDGAGLKSNIIGTLQQNNRIMVINSDEKYIDGYHWVEIIYDDNNGTLKRCWVAKENIEKLELKNETDNDNYYNQVSINSDSAVVLNLEDNSVLFEKNIHEKREPASITKVLTAYIVYKYGNLNEYLTYSANAVNVEGHFVEGYGSSYPEIVKESNKISVQDALHLSLLSSDNATTIALQEYIESKTHKKFIDLMNETAREMGCEDSNFTNSYGYADPKHVSSAYDMAIITSYIANNQPEVIEIMGSKSYELKNGITIEHQSTLVQDNNEVIGCKSGYTSSAQQTMITLFEKDGKKIAVVTLHCDGLAPRNEDAITLSKIGFSKLDISNNIETDFDSRFYKIADISEHQGEISDSNFDIIGSEFEAVIARVTDAGKQDKKGNILFDDYFVYNMRELDKKNINQGMYFLTRATKKEEADKELAVIFDAFDEIKKSEVSVELPFYLDIESNYPNLNNLTDYTMFDEKQTVAEYQKGILKYMAEKIEARGYKVGFYIHANHVDDLGYLKDEYTLWTHGGDYYDIPTNSNNLRESYIYGKKIELSENNPIFQSCEAGIIDNISFDNGAIDLGYADKEYFDSLVEKTKTFNKR